MQIYKIIGDVKNKNILLLQGPMGTFFYRLDRKFAKRGAKTFRIGLNAGDALFSNKKHYTPYRGRPEEWDIFIRNYFTTNKIDMVFLLGDCRFYQSKAIEVARSVGVEVFVFEEGYVRPDFITLERDGVNGYSSLPRERGFYDILEYDKKSECRGKNVKKLGSTYLSMGVQATLYYLVAHFMSFRYPYYQHHRVLNALLEFFYGIRNFLRKFLYKFTEKNLLKHILNHQDGYYFVPLQTHGDFQITRHSKYTNIEEFISEVMNSFALHAPKKSLLVLKHHPVDRGRKNYSVFIAELTKKLKCKERILVCHDLHLPTLLKNAKGTVTVNSTVGISSLYQHTPTFCTGDSFYDIEGLTSKGLTLDQFWREAKAVDVALFDKFRCYLIEKTLINGSFYKE